MTSPRKRRLHCYFASIIVFIISLAATASAQSSGPCPSSALGDEKHLLQTLLCEVQQLRRAIEKSTLLSLRVQLIVEQLRAQQDRVDRANRELEQARRNIDDLELATVQVKERIKIIKRELEHGVIPSRRRELEEELQETQDAIVEQEAKSGQLRDTGSSAAALLQSEQNKLENLRGRLAGLEREIGNAF